jgi:hypothetical protein
MDDRSEIILSSEESFNKNSNEKKTMNFGVCFRENGGFMTIDFRGKDDDLKSLKYFSSDA